MFVFIEMFMLIELKTTKWKIHLFTFFSLCVPVSVCVYMHLCVQLHILYVKGKKNESDP